MKAKILGADEIKEPGYYWYRTNYNSSEGASWYIVEVVNVGLELVFLYTGDDTECQLDGQFIGPLKEPEV